MLVGLLHAEKMIEINYISLHNFDTITCKSSHDEYISRSPQMGIVGLVIYTLEGQPKWFLKTKP